MLTSTMRPKFYMPATMVCALILGLIFPGDLFAVNTTPKSLSFYHTHTGERLQITFAHGSEYEPEALTTVNSYLADHRTGDQIAIDPELLELLYDLQQKLGSNGTYEVISAYRSPATNKMLRSRSNGVASKSQHLLGKAIDVRLDDVSLPALHKAALALQRGGVGYYPKSQFVHVDTGRVRRW